MKNAAMFSPEMGAYSVMEMEKERINVCFNVRNVTHLKVPLEIVTCGGTAIGKC